MGGSKSAILPSRTQPTECSDKRILAFVSPIWARLTRTGPSGAGASLCFSWPSCQSKGGAIKCGKLDRFRRPITRLVTVRFSKFQRVALRYGRPYNFCFHGQAVRRSCERKNAKNRDRNCRTDPTPFGQVYLGPRRFDLDETNACSSVRSRTFTLVFMAQSLV